MTDSAKRDARGRMLGALRRELLGPAESDETLAEFPKEKIAA